MRVLILGNSESIYLRCYVKWMAERFTDSHFDIYSPLKGYLEPQKNVSLHTVSKTHPFISKIPKVRGVVRILEQRKLVAKAGKYDLCHIHLVDIVSVVLINRLRKRSKTLVASIWGGDFYRRSPRMMKLQERVYRAVDYITFTTKETMNAFDSYYEGRYHDKLRLCMFGLLAVEELKKLTLTKEECRERLEIPKDAVVVAIGYNRTPQHRHIQILKSLWNLQDKLPRNIFLAFHMAYGRNEEYVRTAKEKFAASGFQGKFFEEYASPRDVAIFRKACDVMIQVQTTDVLSGSMLEHLYAGNVVITGDWLPYGALDELGLTTIKVSEVSEVGRKLLYVLENLKEWQAKNETARENIYEFASWDRNIDSWARLYMGGTH